MKSSLYDQWHNPLYTLEDLLLQLNEEVIYVTHNISLHQTQTKFNTGQALSKKELIVMLKSKNQFYS